MGLVILLISHELRNGASYCTHQSGVEEWD